jgi:hypothetical protein
VTALITTGCVNRPAEVRVANTQIITTLPTPAPVITTLQTPSNRDPIVGSWQNGMVFYANGSVGSDGITFWRVNKDEKNSYFVMTDQPSPLDKARDVTATEWIYNPVSDSIHKKGSLISIYRV